MLIFIVTHILNNKIEQQIIRSIFWCLFDQNRSRNNKIIEVNVFITLLKGDQSGLTIYK